MRFQAGDLFTDLLLSLQDNQVLIASTGLPAIGGGAGRASMMIRGLLAGIFPNDSGLKDVLSLNTRRQEGERPVPRRDDELRPLWPDCVPGAQEGEFFYYEEEPVPVETPLPKFPPGAVATRRGEKVILHVFVDSNGRPCFIRVVRGTQPFVAHVLQAVRRWTFKPATSNGIPVGVWIELPFAVPGP